jgi:2-polyprenyl-3-methyl-5-hydroxy-6-metoxy-1,4-benzoquinol methylase
MQQGYTVVYDFDGTIPEHNVYNIALMRRLLPSAHGLRVLDAGCCYGHITKAIADLGHHVVGIDLEPTYVENARTLYPGLRFELISVTDSLAAITPPGGFDVVVATEVIEHLFAPQRFLRNMHAVLKPGGVILVSTPYHGYLKNLAIALINGFDKHFMVQQEGGHIKFFSPKTLRAMLVATGFRPDRHLHAGRFVPFWKGMMCRATAVPE